MSEPLGINLAKNEPFKVLIAEDSFPDRQLLKRFLQSSQFEILADVPNGEGIIDFLKYDRKVPDIIFLDYQMNPKNAVETIREIRPTHPDIFIIVVTANQDKAVISELLKLKINAYILKPISKLLLDEKLIQVLGRKDLVLQSKVGAKKKPVKLEELSIPPMPGVAQKVLLFEGDSVSGSSALEQIILPDKAICADILRIANSAYYARTTKVQTIKDAITLLGLKTVKNIVMVQAKKNFSRNLVYSDLFKNFLLEFPILTALVALDISNPLGLKSIRDELFLSTMMNKIGMTLLAIHSPKAYTEILTDYQNGKGELAFLEKEELGIDSTEVGLYIFKAWNMPDLFIKMMKNQNFVKSEFQNVDDYDRALRLADIIAKRLIGLTTSDSELEIAKMILKYYNAPAETLEVFGKDYYEGIQSHPYFNSN